MKSLLKKLLVVLFAAVVVIQFFPPRRNVSATVPGPQDITALHPTTPVVKAILAESCYDCHSDNTRYPWYTRIQPVGWWMQHHVNEGRKELNFSQFGTYTPKRARKKMDETIKEIKGGDMPLSSYVIVHRAAKLDPVQIQQVVDWANGVKASIPAPAVP
ncbi:heme-binding domain-containing protein [Horticoccus luteus]|uniref:Heme-binding domain-containing protein n=1 Tax=Horticoccus luteus TaxID=2862869 RepID=A0A8F9TW55_9BACT|nr:heme-binding domain-containing protein [Horticoccus luteus]QYM78889.1 heme-binding domain-containing protein [Horticoccus luteus]